MKCALPGLLTASHPVNRVARRVCKDGEQWQPRMKPADHHVTSEAPLPLARMCAQTRQLASKVIGRRRDRMTLFGFAGDGKWVARCDCGNYEYRSRIVRWLSLDGPDACRPCRTKHYVFHGKSLGGTR